jgi:heme/copper-type cytochrome/quinol oxidase subunit 3
MTDTQSQDKGPSETAQEKEFELRAHIGSIWSGGRLFIGMYTFIIASLVFTYFYLRSSNSGGLWRLPGQHAPTAFGWTIFILMMTVAFLTFVGQSRLRSGAVLDFQVAAWTGVGCGLLALVLQIIQLTKLGFYPGSSGFASTFVGYAVINLGSILIGTYWLETTVARSHFLDKELGAHHANQGRAPATKAWRADVAAMTYFWGFLAISGVLLTAMFYVM